MKRTMLVVAMGIMMSSCSSDTPSTLGTLNDEVIIGGDKITKPVRPGDGLPNNPPSIYGEPQTSIEIGNAYRFQAAAIDSDNDRLIFSIENRPDWLSFNRRKGILSGTPLQPEVGVFNNIRISVSDGEHVAFLPMFSITVLQSLIVTDVSTQPPSGDESAMIIVGEPPTSVKEGQGYVFTPEVSSDGREVFFYTKSLPYWLTLNPLTGSITGQPGYNDAGWYGDIVIGVSDGEQISSLSPFSIEVINVNRQPIIESTVIEVAENSRVEFQIQASDPDQDTLSLSIKSSPSNGVVEITDNIKGYFRYTPSPDYFGKDSFEVSANDSSGALVTSAVSVTVVENSEVLQANPDNVIALLGDSVTIDVLQNDRGLGDGSQLAITIVSQPTFGLVSVSENGAIDYQVNINEVEFAAEIDLESEANFPPSNDHFVYEVSDTDGDRSSATVNVSIRESCREECIVLAQLSWDPSESANVAGYYVHYGQYSGEYERSRWVGDVTTVDFEIEKGGTHFFALTAENTQGVQSGFSTEESIHF